MTSEALTNLKDWHGALGVAIAVLDKSQEPRQFSTDPMADYGCVPILLENVGSHGWGTMQRLGTAFHVTSDFGIKKLEAQFGDCYPHPNADWHGFGDVMPEPVGDIPVDGDAITCVGFPANSTSVPEVRHFRYCKPHHRLERAHWLHQGPQAVTGGMSGGPVYRGHIGLDDLPTAESIGYLRAEASLLDADGDGMRDDKPFWAAVSFWHDLADPT